MQKRLFIITGFAGSGKTTAVKAFEDAGFYCVDNMPVTLLPNFLDIATVNTENEQNFAFVMDLRTREFLDKYESVFYKLKKSGYQFKILFFTASRDVLIKRYSETRRRHPLYTKNLSEALKKESGALANLKKQADEVIDSSMLTPHQLKSLVSDMIIKKEDVEKQLKITISSFGFKYGAPYDANLISDIRFIKNPFFVSELKNLTGEDLSVSNYVLSDEKTKIFLEKYKSLLDFLIPEYQKEGKVYLKIAIGCTGGLHRSVVIAKEIYNHIKKTNKNIELEHRDITK